MFFKTQAPVEFIIAGLGNPGDKYTFTRHNAGFLCMDYISQKLGVRVNKLKYKALTATAKIRTEEGYAGVLLMQPQTFMNNSGESIREAASFYKVPPEKVFVIYDDSALAVGKMRVRRSGSDGGHNGMKSIIAQLHSNKFPRIRLGVGEKPHPEMDLADHVLGRFTDADKKAIYPCFEKTYDILPLLLSGRIEDCMARVN